MTKTITVHTCSIIFSFRPVSGYTLPIRLPLLYTHVFRIRFLVLIDICEYSLLYSNNNIGIRTSFISVFWYSVLLYIEFIMQTMHTHIYRVQADHHIISPRVQKMWKIFLHKKWIQFETARPTVRPTHSRFSLLSTVLFCLRKRRRWRLRRRCSSAGRSIRSVYSFVSRDPRRAPRSQQGSSD